MSNFEEEKNNYLLKFCHNTIIFQSLIKSNNEYNKKIAYILLSQNRCYGNWKCIRRK